jgi:phage tail-like protein
MLEIDGITQAGFTECSGFGASTDPIEYREGNENPKTDVKTVRKLPGLTKFDNISLKWGLTDSHELYNWYRETTKGKVDRKNGSIILLDLEGKEKVRWNFRNGWPAKWTGPSLNSTGNEVAIETLEIAHEGVEQAA